MQLGPEAFELLMKMDAPQEQKLALFRALEREWQAYQRPTGASGVNEETERLRNVSTYAERKRAKDRARRAAEREELRRLKGESTASSATTPATTGEATAAEGDQPATPGDPEPDASCARVVILTSSLRSEGTQEANASFVDAPSDDHTPADPKKPPTKPPKSQRGTRLPEDWEPSAEEFQLGRDAGLTDEEINRAALEFRNYWCARSRDAAKLSWRLTWHNRVNELGERKHRNGARLAASPNQSGGGRRGAVSFADLYARRHGQAAD